jgi:phage shock protein PspC (stress-responsive transcriptional regulator)
MGKRLYRVRKDKVFGGIAAGLGKYLDIDPIIIRIIIVLITIFHGVGLIIYIILWIVIPEEPIENLYNSMNANISDDDTTFTEFSSETTTIENNTSSRGRTVVGIALIGLGIVFLLEKFLPFFDFELFLAIGLIALGIGLITNFYNK